MECEPCVVYGRRGLGNGFSAFLNEEFKKDCMKKEIIMQVNVWSVGLDVFSSSFLIFFLCLTFPL